MFYFISGARLKYTVSRGDGTPEPPKWRSPQNALPEDRKYPLYDRQHSQGNLQTIWGKR